MAQAGDKSTRPGVGIHSGKLSSVDTDDFILPIASGPPDLARTPSPTTQPPLDMQPPPEPPGRPPQLAERLLLAVPDTDTFRLVGSRPLFDSDASDDNDGSTATDFFSASDGEPRRLSEFEVDRTDPQYDIEAQRSPSSRRSKRQYTPLMHPADTLPTFCDRSSSGMARGKFLVALWLTMFQLFLLILYLALLTVIINLHQAENDQPTIPPLYFILVSVPFSIGAVALVGWLFVMRRAWESLRSKRKRLVKQSNEMMERMSLPNHRTDDHPAPELPRPRSYPTTMFKSCAQQPNQKSQRSGWAPKEIMQNTARQEQKMYRLHKYLALVIAFFAMSQIICWGILVYFTFRSGSSSHQVSTGFLIGVMILPTVLVTITVILAAANLRYLMRHMSMIPAYHA